MEEDRGAERRPKGREGSPEGLEVAESYLGLRSSVVLLHQLRRVELRDGLERVQSHQGAASIGVEGVCHVPGLQTPQD